MTVRKRRIFLAVDKLLRGCGISAPEVFAADPMRGLVLMEDFGGKNFGRSLGYRHGRRNILSPRR